MGTEQVETEAPTQARGLIELYGHASDIQTLQSVAPACNCSIEPGPDSKLGWLYSPKFDGAATPQGAQEEATRMLVRLNGLARLKNPQHRNVDLGDAFFSGRTSPLSQTASKAASPRDNLDLQPSRSCPTRHQGRRASCPHRG